MDQAGRLLLLDSASLYFRAFYGVPDQRTDPSEPPTNAIRGFLDAVLTLSDPANHALVVEAGHAEAARYVADQRRSIDALADWLGHAA